MQQLMALSKQQDINEAVRLGDIYAVLITHNVRKKNFKKVDFTVHFSLKFPKYSGDRLRRRTPQTAAEH